VAYVSSEARQELLDTIADAIDELGAALAALGEAYEQLDERAADTLEEQLFRPVQTAYGRAQRTHAGFAQRFGLNARAFAPAVRGVPSTGVKGFVADAVAAVAQADADLAELQDSMMPVEVGDAELRSGLADVRELLADVAGRAEGLLRTFGR
jgi:hypothetical protein